MFANLTGWHMLAILAIVLLIFGAPKLPALARSMGQSMRIFKGEVDEMKKDGPAEPVAGLVAEPIEPPARLNVDAAESGVKL